MPIAVRLLLESRIRGGVVNQNVRAVRDFDEGVVHHRVSCIHNLPAPPGRAEHILWTDRSVPDLERLPFLQSAVERSTRNSERLGPLDAVPPRPRLFLQPVTEAWRLWPRLDRAAPALAPVH